MCLYHIYFKTPARKIWSVLFLFRRTLFVFRPTLQTQGVYSPVKRTDSSPSNES